MIVLDTNVISEVWRERSDPHVAEWFNRQERLELFVCIPVIAELAYGALRTLMLDRSKRYLQSLDAMVEGGYRHRILPFDLPAAMKYGELLARRELAGRPIGPLDAMIAAVCIVHDATLATRNLRDFEGLDLKLVNPFEARA